MDNINESVVLLYYRHKPIELCSSLWMKILKREPFSVSLFPQQIHLTWPMIEHGLPQSEAGEWPHAIFLCLDRCYV
jgi:hypothetical protein